MTRSRATTFDLVEAKLPTYFELRVDLSDHGEVEGVQGFGSVYGDHTCAAHSLQENLWFHLTRHLIQSRERDNRTDPVKRLHKNTLKYAAQVKKVISFCPDSQNTVNCMAAEISTMYVDTSSHHVTLDSLQSAEGPQPGGNGRAETDIFTWWTRIASVNIWFYNLTTNQRNCCFTTNLNSEH